MKTKFLVRFGDNEGPFDEALPEGWALDSDHNESWEPFGWNPAGNPVLNIPSVSWRLQVFSLGEVNDGSPEA